MKPAGKIVLATAGATLLLSISSFLVSLPDANDTLIFRLSLLSSVVLASLDLGAALLFLVSLRAYKAEMRRAFTWLSAGIILVATGTLQIAIINAFSWLDTIWVTSGGIVLPYLLSSLLLYWGVRKFVRLVGMNTALLRASIVIPAVAVVSVLSTLLPHVSGHQSTEMEIDGSTAILLWTAQLDLIAGILILKARGHMGSHYTRAMTWLSAALLWATIVGTLAAIVVLSTRTSVNIFSLMVVMLSVFNSLLLLGAGYAFTKTEEY